MDPREYELMFQEEGRHWWYRGMEAITRCLLEKWVPSSGRLTILDAGCGTGAAMTTYLAEFGEVTGVDLYPQALEYCRMRNAPRLARASILELPFASASFDLLASFDVLYERAVSSDQQALREFARVLCPGGFLILRLPAYNWLRGSHDRRVHTRQRYTKPLLRNLLIESGFHCLHLSYANMILLPFAVMKRLSERLVPTQEVNSDLSLDSGIFNNVFHRILSFEAPFVSSSGLPYGLSVVAVAKKPG